MDDAKLGFGLLILMIVFLGLLAHATEVEYISPSRQKELQELFDRSTLKTESLHRGQKWTCEMYGVRSHMQVQHDLQLYTLENNGEKSWSNKGAQLISDYREDAQELVGSNQKFRDEIKVADDGHLVSRLSSNLGPRPVLAYSVCKQL